MLRLTAKSTMFGHKTFTSWIVESVGTVPIKRRKDFVDGNVDNTDVMLKLMEVCEFVLCADPPFIHKVYSFKALEMGDAICLFPEGVSRYHPSIAPLKTGGRTSHISCIPSSE
jgi:1-acyl-sn-glycerol-3-phosphate acyltransferase